MICEELAMKYHFDAALPPGFTVDAFRQAVESQGARFAQHIPRGELQLEEHIWTLAGDRGAVRYIHDHFVNVPFVRTETDVSGRATELMRELEPVLSLLYTGELM